MPRASFQLSISAITAQGSRNLLPAPNQAEGLFSALLLRLVTHLADLGLAASCPFLSQFLVFEHIFQSNNSPERVSKFWATVFLGPYLSCQAQNLQKIPVCIPELAVATEHAQFSSGRQSWSGRELGDENNAGVTTKNGA